MFARIGYVLAMVLSLSACAVMESTSDHDAPGIVYHLPRTLLTVAIKQQGDTVTLKVDATTVQDLDRRYVLNYRKNPFHNDRLCVTASKALLRSVEIATEDATPKVVIALAELGAKVGQPRFAAMTGGPRRALAQAVREVTFQVDPFDPQSTAAARAQMDRTFNGELRMDLSDLWLLVPPNRLPADRDRRQFANLRTTPSAPCEGKGVCFRTATRIPVRLTDANGKLLAMDTPLIVNPFHTGHMDLDRAFMVEKLTRLTFTDGVLTQVVLKKPSEALQTVKLPLAVADAILAVPANFVGRITNPATIEALQTEITQRKQAEEALEQRLAEIALRVKAAETGTEGTPFQLQCNPSW